MEHVNIPTGEIHSPHNWEFADSAARLASVQADATLIGRVAIQLSDHTTWRLASVSPAVWSQIDATMPTDLDSIQFDTTPEAVPTTTGALFWDNADGNKTLSLVMDGATGTTQQIGEETYYRVKASSAITEGQAVMVTGSVGASGVLTAARATDLTYDNPYRILGVATENIAANAFGFVTAFGMVRGFNTTGASVGETWADGDALYYSPVNSGSLTNIPPQAPVAKALIAHVVHAGTSGSIFVRPVLGSAFGSTDGNVKFTALSDNNFIVYNAATGLWENRAPAAVKTALSLGNVDNTSDADKPVSTATAAALGMHTGDTSNPHSVTKAQVGLGNVDNTSDADKPVSTATAAALASKEATVNKGVPSGYASLDAGGKVPAAQLPSFVDDVIEVDTLPVTGESGKIYVTLSDGKTWRWGGTAYAEISASPGSTDAVPEGVSNLYHTAARVRDAVLTGLSTASSAVVTAADSVLTAFGKLQAQLTLKLNAANPSYTGGLTGDTGVVNIGSGQLYKDTAGNFGLGVTPSAWSLGRSVEVGQVGNSIFGYLTETHITNNCYFNSGWKYAYSGLASRYTKQGGGHSWLTAPFGTAGNAISFTQAMTLDASGVQTLSAPTAQQIIQPSSTTNNALTRYINGGGTAFVGLDNSSGGIGGAYSLNIWHNGAYPIVFGTSGVERARINVPGFLKASNSGSYTGNGLSGTATYHQFASDLSGGTCLAVSNSNIGAGVCLEAYANTAATGFLFQGLAAGSVTYRVLTSGNVQNVNNNYGAISDLKLKENIVDVTPKLAKLLQVRIVNYTLKADPNKTKLMGVIAQELEQISPGLIEETPDYEEVTKTREVEVPAVDAVLDEDGNEVAPVVPATTRTEEYTERVPTGTFTKSVKYSVFVPMLIKGVQEQQAQIEALQAQLDTQNTVMQLLAARLEALEAK